MKVKHPFKFKYRVVQCAVAAFAIHPMLAHSDREPADNEITKEIHDDAFFEFLGEFDDDEHWLDPVQLESWLAIYFRKTGARSPTPNSPDTRGGSSEGSHNAQANDNDHSSHQISDQTEQLIETTADEKQESITYEHRQ